MIKKKLEMSENLEPVNLRYEDKKKVRENTKKVNDIIEKIKTKDLNGTNLLILAGANVVADLVGRKGKRTGKKQEPFWRRRMKKQIKDLESDITRLEQWRVDKLESKYWKVRLQKKYFVKNKGVSTVIEELKQRVKVIKAKIRKYDARNDTFHQNRLFETNQRLLFEKLEGMERGNDVKPNADESTAFWNGIWGQDVRHNEKAEWMRDIEEKCKDIKRQDDIKMNVEDIKKQVKKTPNWKSSGPDGVHGYWIKNFANLHERISEQLNGCLEMGVVPEWMTKGRTCLILKDRSKGGLLSNYRPITCLPLMWKLLTGILDKVCTII